MHRKWAVLALMAALGGCGGEASQPAENVAAPVNESAYAPPATVHFVNSRGNALSNNRQRFYVDFAFDYPSSWAVTPPRRDGTERNFVRVAAPSINGFEPFSLNVGLATGSGDPERDRREIEHALPEVARNFGASLPGYRLASTGRSRVGPYESWGWRFSASAPGMDGGRPARLNGRGDIILPPGATRGVLIISLVTDRSDEMSAPERVGEAGTLKAVYDSFRLAAPVARRQSAT